MDNSNIISFSDYLKKKQSKIIIHKQLFDALSEDIKMRPELIEWFNFQSLFNKHKLFLHSLFTSNHRSNNINPNAGYFVSFTEEQLEENVSRIIEANEWLDRPSILIDAKNCTFKNIAKQLYNTEPNDTLEAWDMFEEILLASNNVIVISNMSKSKVPSRKSSCARTIIKINDDAHFKGIKPKSDILFVDSANFLERSWSHIGIYINIFA